MLICFGVSWPISIWKTWTARRTEGKSLAFLAIIFVGYLCGIAAKLVAASVALISLPWVTALYAANACMVALDFALVARFRRAPAGRHEPGDD